MHTVTLAQIYEMQGLKEEALQIYQEILKKDPNNHEARVAIRRLSGVHRHFAGVNEAMKKFFITMQSEEEFSQFEEWLARLEG
jgi:tetratricopeptide (TPR) repeat protein